MRSSYVSSQIAQQFINCCAFYEFTKCAAQFINCANSQIAPNTGTGYTVLPAILPAVEGIILRMLRALKKNLYKKPKKAKKKSCLSEGSNPGIRTHKQCL